MSNEKDMEVSEDRQMLMSEEEQLPIRMRELSERLKAIEKEIASLRDEHSQIMRERRDCYHRLYALRANKQIEDLSAMDVGNITNGEASRATLLRQALLDRRRHG